MTIFWQEVVAVFKLVDDSGLEALIEICKSISKYKAAARGQLDRLVSSDLGSLVTSATVPKTGERSGPSGAVWSKQRQF